MKNLKSITSKGFTLIELLVVVSIISLLSSVVLASVSTVRERAKISAFRQQMNQFINALELYYLDNGKYPYQNENYFFSIETDGDEDFPSDKLSLNDENLLGKYLQVLPEPIDKVSDSTAFSWQYSTRSATPAPGYSHLRCKGDSVLPKYTIRVQHSVTQKEYLAVPNWRPLEFLSPQGVWSGSIATYPTNDNFKICFSI